MIFNNGDRVKCKLQAWLENDGTKRRFQAACEYPGYVKYTGTVTCGVIFDQNSGDLYWVAAADLELLPPSNYTFQTDAVPVAAPLPEITVDKLCDCSIHQLLHGGCKCGGR